MVKVYAMFHLVIADSELELIPKELLENLHILKHAKKRDKEPECMLLDSNFHHRAMQDLVDQKRRGRPDIIYAVLLLAQDSVLNREKNLRIYIHTRHNQVISIDPAARLPKSYNRFVGLFESVLVGNKTPLVKCEELSLNDLVSKLNPSRVIAFSENGKPIELPSYVDSVSDNTCFIIGGFPHGDFIADVSNISDEVITIYKESLNAITVASELLTCLRYAKKPKPF